MSRRIQAEGARVCLFTDQANPTSNKIYAALFVGVAHERTEPLRHQVHVVLGRDPQAARCRRRVRQLAEFVQPRVPADLDAVAADAGQFGGAQFGGRQGPVDPEQVVTPLV
ncbi:hypothetical protein [Micromonospora viridifaciens]|uniref:hypothetical protein n=1 Tax=Micromonospora viridifaciens TaxID=1881 RepID=UPI001E378975|nr:hypothetical protein [Micromonospora viridifaciens]